MPDMVDEALVTLACEIERRIPSAEGCIGISRIKDEGCVQGDVTGLLSLAAAISRRVANDPACGQAERRLDPMTNLDPGRSVTLIHLIAGREEADRIRERHRGSVMWISLLVVFGFAVIGVITVMRWLM